MKHFLIACLAGFFITISVFSQQKTTTYKVNKGETVPQIAQKFKITPFDIYQLNPDAQSGLKPGNVLLIPIQSAVTASKKITTIPIIAAKGTHLVLAKETLFGIQKKYNITDLELQKANPFLEQDGLQIGQVLIIPGKKTVVSSSQKKGTPIVHEVLPKETKYSIAKQYGITIEELEKQNPEVVVNLPIGYKLNILSANKTRSPLVSDSKKTTSLATTKPIKKESLVDYTIQTKETLYSLSKKFGISQEQLLLLNPFLVQAVNVGDSIKVPFLVEANTTSQSKIEPKKIEVQTEIVSAPFRKATGRKKLVMLLPFNLTKIEGDTLNSTVALLKKDKFLNMTLDFYSGALMAIDSARKVGMPIDVSIFDSQETKSSSNVASIIQDNNVLSANAIIGPFYQSNVEKTAELVKNDSIPVISPLSKDPENSFANSVQSVTPATTVKNAMFEYLRGKNGTIIAVIDKKRESARQYMLQNQPGVLFAKLSENGNLLADALKSQLVPNTINYVILETGSTTLIKATIAALISEMTKHQVQLVVLEPNETLDTDEISMANLIKLKLMWPSATRENVSNGAQQFAKEYKKKNKMHPNAFAMRGFDVTFDTLWRLSQSEPLLKSFGSVKTEQIENKFDYVKTENGGLVNAGVFILQYDTDFRVKVAQ